MVILIQPRPFRGKQIILILRSFRQAMKVIGGPTKVHYGPTEVI